MITKMIQKVGKYLLIALLGLSFFHLGNPSASAAQLTDLPEEVVLSNGFRVTFDGVDYQDQTSTWYYTVEELPNAQDLGNWVLETPFCAPILDAGPEPWEIVDPDPNANLSGVKWETGAGFTEGQFWVKLDTTGQVGITNLAAKGPDVVLGEIAGPTCIEEDPPDKPRDREAPTIDWVEPVGSNQRYDVQEGVKVKLVLSATDNTAVNRVVILRWDAIREVYATIAVDRNRPYQTIVSANELNPTWNYVIAASFDDEGNQSEWKWIYLYVVVDEPLFRSGGASLFVPVLKR